MNKTPWCELPKFEQKVFGVGDTVRILPSTNPNNKNKKTHLLTGRLGTVMSGLCEQMNPNSTAYIGYEIKVDGYRDSINPYGYCLMPVYRLEAAKREPNFQSKVLGRLQCLIGNHEMNYGFGSPVIGHCMRGCGYFHVDAN